jgi:hypothetical protein
MTGFMPSTGHIMGDGVCAHHKYGPIPEGIDYLEITNVVLAKPVVDIFIGHVFIGRKVCAVEYQTGDSRFWIHLQTSSIYMSAVSASSYYTALGFALNVASSLNESLDQHSDPSSSPRSYESWDEAAARMKKV